MRKLREHADLRGPATRSRTWAASAAALAAAAAALVTGTPAHAAPAPAALPAASAPGSSLAVFEGRTLDMTKGWGAAKACLIWRAAGTVQCFRTVGELTAMETKLAGTAKVAATMKAAPGRSASGALASCSSPTRLWEHGLFWTGNNQGRVLSFWDRGYWQNLGTSNFNFNDQMSSYKVGACYSHLAEHHDGAGYWYPGNTGPWAEEGTLRQGWNDRVSSLKLD